MSRIASVKETGEELTQAEWERFEKAVAAEVRKRPASEPYGCDADANMAEAVEPGKPEAKSRAKARRQA